MIHVQLGLTIAAISLAAVQGDQKIEIVRAVSKANELLDDVVAEDYKKVAALLHPNVVRSMGGRAKVISLFIAQSHKPKESAVSIIKYKAQYPDLVYRKKERIFVIIPARILLKTANGEVESLNWLLGISTTRGRTWSFAFGHTFANDPTLRSRIFPDLPPEVVFPDYLPSGEPILCY